MNFSFQNFEHKFRQKGFSTADLQSIYNNDDIIKQKIISGKERNITVNDIKRAIDKQKRSAKSCEKLWGVKVANKKNDVEKQHKISAKDENNWLRDMTYTDEYSDDDNDDVEGETEAVATQSQLKKLRKECDKLRKDVEGKDKQLSESKYRNAAYCMQALGISTSEHKSIWQTLSDLRSDLSELKKLVLEYSESNRRYVELERITTNYVPGESVDPLTHLSTNLKAALDLFNDMVQKVNYCVRPHVVKLQQQVNRLNSPDELSRNYERLLCHSADVVEMILKIIDAKMCNSAFTKRRLTIKRSEQSSSLCPGLSDEINIVFDAIEIERENGINTRPSVIDNHLELCDCDFSVTSNVKHNNVCNVNGALLIKIDASLVFAILTDKDWRPPTKLYRNESVADIGNLTTGILSNRPLYLLRYLLHAYTHILCAVHPDLRNPHYDHPADTIYEEISNFFEPRRLLQP